MRKLLLFSTICLLSSILDAQISRIGDDIQYKVSTSGQFGSGDNAPFWQSANKYGLASTDNNSGYIRAFLKRETEADSLRRWRLGYGVDLAVPFGYESKFIVQQLYAEARYRIIQLSVGQKERPAEMKNANLSTGGMAMGTNARPIPQIRLETPDFFVIPGTKNWVFLKGHLSYGWYTDNKWQREFNDGKKSALYTADSRYHSKAGYMRIGNLDKFPLVLTGGAEMVCQFGGTVWNRGIAGGNADGSYTFGSGIKEYLQAFIPTGSDVTDRENPNVMGNTIGSYQARLDYHGKGWMASIYGEHFFEDHSMMGFDFAWKDFLLGAEIHLPKNPAIATLLYEHMRTTDQSGPTFLSSSTHVRTIGGCDNYYNHNIYGAYQHAGYVMGNPLIVSPVYNTGERKGHITCYDNRITSNHFGISGQPIQDLSYRILFTHTKSLGSYYNPNDKPLYGNYLLVEASYNPHHAKGLGFTASYGQNGGNLIGKGKGGMLTVSYSGWLNRNK